MSQDRKAAILAFACQTLAGMANAVHTPTMVIEAFSTPTDQFYHGDPKCPKVDHTFTTEAFPAPVEVYSHQGLKPCKTCWSVR